MSEVSLINQGEEEPQLELPPGFRFHPTDEEVVSHYLTPKALDLLFTCLVIADVDFNKCEPWDLPRKAKMGEKEWYFFWHKDRRYPTGMRINRATASGYWKATGRDKEIFRGRDVLVGMKKTLVFYLGRAPRGRKTPWVMHEYRLEGKLPPHLPRASKDEWAVCRVFNKEYLAAKQPGQTAAASPATRMEPTSNSLPFLVDDFLAELPPLMDSPFTDGLIDFKGKGGAAGTSTSDDAAADMSTSGYQVKTEQKQKQNPTTPLAQDPCSYYFSMPVTNHNPGGDDQQTSAAMRKRRNTEARALPGVSSDMASRPLHDELCFTDYSNMLNF